MSDNLKTIWYETCVVRAQERAKGLYSAKESPEWASVVNKWRGAILKQNLSWTVREIHEHGPEEKRRLIYTLSDGRVFDEREPI